MSDHQHLGLHPDPDSLNAFIEGALPEHERLQCLAHLADCPRCREVVFLAQEPAPAPAAAQPVRTRWRWIAPMPVFASAVAFCLLILAVWLYVRHTPGTPAPKIVAHTEVAPPIPTPRSVPVVTPKKPRIAKPLPHVKASGPARRPLPPLPPPMVASSVPPVLQPPPPVAIQNAEASLPPALQAETPVPPKFPSLSAISGTVIDATGAVIPRATIRLRQIDGTITANARADLAGQFQVPGLPAGKYELQIDAPGFRRALSQVDVQPSEVASIKSQLEVGSVTESVEVTASPSTIQTSSASMSTVRTSKIKLQLPRPIPGGLPAEITLTTGKTMLAVNSNGAVFVSRNSGTSWKSVKKVWPGKAESLAVSDTWYQLTTDTGSLWQSRDGSHWSPAPSKH